MPMPRNGTSDQGGLLTALGAHLELLGSLLKKADACDNQVPQSSVASLFKKASTFIADDPSAKKLASHDGRKAAKGPNGMQTSQPNASSASLAAHPTASSTSLALPRSSSETQLLAIALSGGEEEMLSALEARADPNRVFSNFTIGPRKFVQGTALSIAAQKGHLEVASALLRYGARPDATYSITVGRERTTESFPIGFSTVWGENIELLEMLIDARADLHTMTSSLHATMLWEAAYFGKEKMARYVLDRGIDMEAAALSQDNRKWKFTALHAACYKGETGVVAMLLRRSAEVEGRNGDGHTPLADAIVKGHGDIVRMLIAARGELFNAAIQTTSERIQRNTSRKFGIAFMMPQWSQANTIDPNTPIELLFHEANDHVIAEAAKGLQIAPRPIDTLTFIKFLASKGNAPVEIMKAVSQKQELWYWNEKMERAHVQTAMMKPDAAFIVGYGPHSVRLKATFDRKERATPQVEAFIQDIAPETRNSKKKQSGSRRVRGRLMMCDVPEIFFNPEVLQTMMKCEIPEFFEMESVQAIVNVHWRQVKQTAHFQILFQVLYCTASMCLNILLLEFEDKPWRPAALTTSVWVCIAFWIVEVSLELFEIIGFCHVRLFTAVYCRGTALLDWARLLLSGGILSYVVVRQAAAKQAVWFNVSFGFVMLVRWMRLLYSFRGVKFFGIYLLPITTCLSHVIPFCAVLFPFVLGFANMYYAFGLQNPVDALVIILQLILLGEVSLDDLEGANPIISPVTDAGAGQTEPQTYVVDTMSTDYYVVVRVFLVVCAMVMSTAMMNIFIAVLSEEYHRAYRTRYGMFFRSRAHLAIREYFTWRLIRHTLYWVSRPARQVAEDVEDEYGGNYIWYFMREEDEATNAPFGQ